MNAKRLLVSLVCCVVVGGCTRGDFDESDEASTARAGAQLIAFTRSLPGRGEVWVARMDGSGKRRLAEGRAPAISPDGRWVAFHGGREDTFGARFYRDLMLVATSGGQPRLLMRETEEPVWSPDSRRVAAARRLSISRRALLTIEVASGRSAMLARGAIYGWSFSPAADEIAYARAEPAPWGVLREKVDVYVADANGGNGRRVTDDGDSAYPVWGRQAIAFARLVPYRGWGAHEIWLMRPDGGRRRLLTKTPRSLLVQGVVGLIPVAWSADARALLAALLNEFGGIPYGVDPKTGSVRRIGDYSYHAWPDGLSRDGRFVLVSDSGVEVTRHTRIEVAPYAGGRGQVIARRAGEASWNR
jgi:Tol biopolymer transport system component